MMMMMMMMMLVSMFVRLSSRPYALRDAAWYQLADSALCATNPQTKPTGLCSELLPSTSTIATYY